MKTLVLTRGRVSVVDDATYKWASKFSWHCSKRGYAERSMRDGKKSIKVKLHREIMHAPKGVEVDHRDGDSLNNRRRNLRRCSHLNNCRNRVSRKAGYSSKYMGVVWHKGAQKWMARIAPSGKGIYLGVFVSERDAALAYNRAARKYYGRYAHLNEVA